jgi:hypothetical protein
LEHTTRIYGLGRNLDRDGPCKSNMYISTLPNFILRVVLNRPYSQPSLGDSLSRAANLRCYLSVIEIVALGRIKNHIRLTIVLPFRNEDFGSCSCIVALSNYRFRGCWLQIGYILDHLESAVVPTKCNMGHSPSQDQRYKTNKA